MATKTLEYYSCRSIEANGELYSYFSFPFFPCDDLIQSESETCSFSFSLSIHNFSFHHKNMKNLHELRNEREKVAKVVTISNKVYDITKKKNLRNIKFPSRQCNFNTKKENSNHKIFHIFMKAKSDEKSLKKYIHLLEHRNSQQRTYGY